MLQLLVTHTNRINQLSKIQKLLSVKIKVTSRLIKTSSRLLLMNRNTCLKVIIILSLGKELTLTIFDLIKQKKKPVKNKIIVRIMINYRIASRRKLSFKSRRAIKTQISRNHTQAFTLKKKN